MSRLPAREGEERKRKFEVAAMVVISLVLFGISRLETRLFELSERLSIDHDLFASVIYFSLVNINVVLILVLSFLIFRNFAKLMVERRRGVIGSRLKTKLVGTLLFFALAPTALMFYVSSQFITTSFDTWFSKQVRDTMQQTREAGAMVYKQDQRRLESLARIALQRLEYDDSGEIFEPSRVRNEQERLQSFVTEYRVAGLKVYNQAGRLLWSSKAEDAQSFFENREEYVFEALNNFRRKSTMVTTSTVLSEDQRDVVKGMAPVVDPASGVIIGLLSVEERFETQIMRSIDAILNEFKNLKPGVQLIRISYTVLLVVMAVLITFSATWLGFYVAKQITGPLQSLAEATREVALGNYGVTLTAKSSDETGQLVRSFNQMTRDLLSQKEEVERAKARLESTNVELEARRKYMEVVLKNIAAGVVSCDSAGSLTSINNAAERILGIKARSLIGRPIKESASEVLLRDLWGPLSERMGRGASYQGQVELELEGRQTTLLCNMTRIREENGEELGTVLVFDDASEQVKVQRIAAWREVARRIAHEIKNPITPIKLSAQRLLRRFQNQFEGADRGVFESCIETILVQVDSLRDLVNEFSKFSRLPSVQTQLSDVNEIIEEVNNLYRVSYPEITFDVSGLSPLPLIPLDRDQMSRVFVNVIINAISAIEGVGDSGRIEFRSLVLHDANALRVEISDNGPGVPAKLRDRVFEPYFSTKKEGTGLGLAIVNQIVSDHGGYVRIAERNPRGTTVIIELPLGEGGNARPVDRQGLT